MKEYDLTSIGTGSAMSIVEAIMRQNPETKIAVIDKDEPGGICLTRGCIPSKLLLYPAELVRTIEKADALGVDVDIRKVDFKMIMERMRGIVNKDISIIRQALLQSKNVDYYPTTAEFVAPYTLKVGDETIKSQMIFLCTGSKPAIPPIKGLDKVRYLTSDTVLEMSQLPRSIAIIGGGYVAAEYCHFFSVMGSRITVIGRNPQFLPQEEQEISALAERELQKHMSIITNHEVQEVENSSSGKKNIAAFNRESKEKIMIKADELLIATGRTPNTDILSPEKGGIKTDEKGWIIVDEYLETSQPNVWAFGDANGKYPFKHVANYEAGLVYRNVVLKEKIKVNYRAVPHAVFTYPEIASVGFGEKEAVEKYGKGRVLIGFYRYQDTAKGEAMNVEDCFVKVIIERNSMRILGAHIIGPYASILIQEVTNLMYTPLQSVEPINIGMHIHPALSEVVARAFGSLMTVDQYHHVLKHYH